MAAGTCAELAPLMMPIASPSALFASTNYDTLLPPGTWVWVWPSSSLSWRIGRIVDPNIQPGRLLVNILLPEGKVTPETNKPRPVDGQRVVSLFVPRWNVIPYDAVSRQYQDSLADYPEPKFSCPSPALLEDIAYIERYDSVSLASLVCERSKSGMLYTTVGTHVLIGLDPLRMAPPQVSDSELFRVYATQPIAELDPHPFLLLRKARDALRTSRSQAVVLMGCPESGRGQIAASMTSFLCYQDATIASRDQQLLVIEIESAIMVLQAMTQRALDTFRSIPFAGLTLHVILSSGGASVLGLKIALWAIDLAPLSASIRHKGERLPHIFYSFLSSVVALEGDDALPVTSFLAPFDALAVLKFLPPPLEDVKSIHLTHFRQVLSALATLGFSETEQADILRIVFLVALAAYTSQLRGRGSELSEALTSGSTAATLVTHLGIPDMDIDMQRLISQNPDMLLRLGTSLYTRLLLYLVDRINDYLRPDGRQTTSITIVYAPGFVHAAATLSDLLRNITDDILIAWFTEGHIERTRRSLIAEGVPASVLPSTVSYPLEIVQALVQPPSGLLTLLDTTALEFSIKEDLWHQHRLMRAAARLSRKPSTAEPVEAVDNPYTHDFHEEAAVDFVSRLMKEWEGKPYFIFKEAALRSKQFAVIHACGTVSYSAVHFLEDNAALRLPPTLQRLLRRSDEPFLETLIRRTSPAVSGLLSPLAGAETLRFSTLSGWLRVVAEDVTSAVARSSPCYYVCCLSPNITRDSTENDINYMARQLRIYRITVLCQLHQRAFPVFFTHHTFVQTFLPIILFNQRSFSSILRDSQKERAAARLLAEVDVPRGSFWLGPDSVLLSRPAALSLEQRRHEIISVVLPAVERLQYSWKTFAPRAIRQRLRQKLVRLQSEIRRAQAVQRVSKQRRQLSLILGTSLFLRATYIPPDTFTLPEELKQEAACRQKEVEAYQEAAAIQLQAWWRCMLAVQHAKRLRLDKAKSVALIALTAHTLGEFTYKKLLGTNTVLIQSHIRGWIQRRRYLRLVKLRMAVIPIKRIARRIIALQTRLHMLAILKNHRLYRDLIRHQRDLAYAALMIQKVWRGHFVRTQYRTLRRAAIHCIDAGRVIYHRIRYQTIKQYIVFIQRWWKALFALQNATAVCPWRVPVVVPSGTKPKDTQVSLNDYLRRELIAFSLLRPPTLLYQAFWRTSKLVDVARDCLLFLSLQVGRPALEVYPQGWAWPLLHLLHSRSEVSWDLQRTLNPKYNNFTLEALTERAFSGRVFPSTPTSREVAESCLIQAPRLLILEELAVGGHHSMLLLTEPDIPVITPLRRQQHAQKIREARWVSHVYVWGWNDRGQLGTPNASPITFLEFDDAQYDSVMDPLTGHITTRLRESISYTHAIRSVGAGDDHCGALTTSGVVFTWGDNRMGQCGHGPKYLTIREPRVVEGLRSRSVSEISVGARHMMALIVSGDVFIWGAYSHVGLETLPPYCNIYYPIQVPIYLPDKNGEIEKCVSIRCGSGFNLALSTDPYCVKVWGRNDAGQLGLGESQLTAVHVPTDLVLADLPRSPEAFLRVTQVACGSNFVAACVKPSRGRVFLWGAFSVVDPAESAAAAAAVKTAAEAARNPFLQQTTLRKVAKPGMLAPPVPSFSRIRAIRVPTAVSHSLWEGMAIVHVTCGHVSHVSVALENQDVYGFDELLVNWYTKGTADVEKAPQEDTTQRILPFRAALRSRPDTEGSTSQQNRSNIKNDTPNWLVSRVPTLQGSFHLEPFLYQYRYLRPGVTATHVLRSTYNSKGFQVDYVIGRCRHPELVRPKPLSETPLAKTLIIPLEASPVPPPVPKSIPEEEAQRRALPGSLKTPVMAKPSSPRSRGAAYLQAPKKEAPKEMPKHVLAPKPLASFIGSTPISPAKAKGVEGAKNAPPPLPSAKQKPAHQLEKLRSDTPLSGLSSSEIEGIARLAKILFDA